ncbi:MAG: DUF2796 domain-containing protein [Gammaproteobacteria bacterium]|nr:DUF2796 domain-containing protein [Gammaproteobacteria bacterium]MBU1482227.1 DUF2796 domain-containing protein [Gammaproteobacteria bacterium]
MSQKYLLFAALAALIGNSPIVSAHELGAHVHGVATLQIAVDEKNMTLYFSSPLDNLLGFEHLPRDAKQKSAVKNMADNLNKAEQLFIPTAEAQCTLQSVKLDSLVLDQKKDSQHREESGGHADLDGEFVFACKQTGKLHDLEVKLFDTFPNLHQMKVEVATLKKQASAKLTPDQRRASW